MISAILKLHHAAYRCRDSEETRRFYEDFLGLQLVDTIYLEQTKTGRSSRVLQSMMHLYATYAKDEIWTIGVYRPRLKLATYHRTAGHVGREQRLVRADHRPVQLTNGQRLCGGRK